MNNFCKNCGKELKEGQNVCPNCGTIIRSEEETTNKKAVTGFILGIISIVAWLLPLAGYPVSICGIVFSSKGLKSTTNKGQAIAGLILSIVFLVFTLINSLAGVFIVLNNMY